MIKGVAKTYIPNDWKELIANRYVAFIDIMGFKAMVNEKSSKDLYELMSRLHKIIKTNAAGFGEDHYFDNHDQTIDELIVTIITFSDSIIVFTKDDSERCFESFSLTVASLTEDLFLEKIPFKGGVAHGEMTLDFEKGIFFGKPFIDAYELQEKIAFYSVACHSTFSKKITTVKPYHPFFEYDCPINPKSNENTPQRYFTIFPLGVNSDNPKDYTDIRSNIVALGADTTEKVRKYYNDTVSYLDKIRDSINK